MSDMNPSRIASYEKTRHDPSDPSAPDPLPHVNDKADRPIATALTCSKTNGLTADLPAEGIGSADDLYEKAVMRAKPWLQNRTTGEPKRPKIAWTRTGTDNK